MDRLSRRFGDLGNRLGDVIEGLISPNLKEKFSKYGFSFGGSTTKYEILAGKRVVTDIDVLLRDGDSIMAVEVKTKPMDANIIKHIWRMEQILNYPDDLTRGKKIYGAIAGAVFDEDVKEMAFEAGFYVICQTGDTVNIITPPENFVPKCWTDTTK